MANSARQGVLEVSSISRRHLRPIRVWYSAPAYEIPVTSVLVVMTGRQRNAAEYLDGWRRHTNGRRVLLLVPEMSRQLFPGAREYNQGGVMSRSGRVRPPTRWSLGEIDSIVAQAGRRLLAHQPESYSLYGHSAGAQFVHRLVLLGQSSNLQRAVAANAGWYTQPDADIPYPYGLGGLDPAWYDVERAFRTLFTVLVGSADVDPDEDGVRHDVVVDRTGLNRRQRGEQFLDVSRSRAADAAVDFLWAIALVPGATHSNSEMSAAACEVLFDGAVEISDAADR